MTLIQTTVQAKVIGPSREVNTKYGLRQVVDVVTATGERKAIWKGAGDQSIARLVDGERVTLHIDGKGNVQAIEGAYERVQAQREISPAIEPPAPRPMGFGASLSLPMEAERQLQRQMATAQPVASPVTALGQLFAECLAVADGLVGEGDRVRVALALFDRLPQS